MLDNSTIEGTYRKFLYTCFRFKRGSRQELRTIAFKNFMKWLGYYCRLNNTYNQEWFVFAREIRDTTDPVFILQETGAFPPTDGISGRLLGVDEAPDTFSVDVCMRGGKWCPMFRIGNQSFTLSACEDKESAQFMAGLLSRALKNIYNTNLNHAN